jgi:hypothetical protein
MLHILIIIIVLFFVLGSLPTWNFSRSWGYGPSGLGAVVLLIFLFLLLTHRL